MRILIVAESSQDLTQGTLYHSFINSHGWLKTALHRFQCICIISWKYLTKRRTGAAALIRGRRFFWGGAYWSKYGNLHRKHAELLLNVLSNNSVIDGYMTTGRPGALLICISRFKQTNTYLLLAECEVRTASYGPSFSLPFMVQARSAWAMKTTKEITRIHNLPYGPSKRG